MKRMIIFICIAGHGVIRASAAGRCSVSICDCMNYILEEEDLKEAFRRVREFLKEDGVFVFDMNSHYKYKEILACNTFAEDREDASFIWDNFYDEEERINEYQLSLFIQN